MDQHEKWMKEAVEISREKMNSNQGGPFGAVIVKDEKVIAQGWNRVTSSNDPTAHAEVDAIRKACEVLGTFSLEGASIYSSCEPCPMCLSAVYWARLDHLYFGNSRADAAAIDFDDEFLYQEVGRPIHARKIPTEQLGRDHAIKVFREWEQKADKVQY